MSDTPTPRTDEWGTISKEDGHWSSHKRRERWIKTAPLKTLEELQTELTAVTEQRDEALSDLEFRRDLYALQTKQLDDVREQRDRLAENNNRIIELLKDGLQTDGSHHKQWYLNEVLKLINTDIAKDVEMHWTHDKGIAP